MPLRCWPHVPTYPAEIPGPRRHGFQLQVVTRTRAVRGHPDVPLSGACSNARYSPRTIDLRYLRGVEAGLSGGGAGSVPVGLSTLALPCLSGLC